MKIKEIILVEGRDDELQVKRAVDADVIQTHGYAYGNKLKNRLKEISKTRGIIILTDPDYVGKRIRDDISRFVPGCKHAYLPQNKALKKNDVGVENASVEDIKNAIGKAKPKYLEESNQIEFKDILELGLTGYSESGRLREAVCEKFSIEYGNTKAFIKDLNAFGIGKEDLKKATEKIKNEFDFS